MKNKILFFICFFCSLNIVFAQENMNTTNSTSDQQMDDFSVAGYADKGKKAWEVAGKSADISSNVIKLQNVESKLYGEKEDVKLTAQKGDFDRKEGNMHLEKDVVVTTSSGGKMQTDSLNWDRNKQVVSTKDAVKIEKEDIVIQGQGAKGFPDLKKVNLEKDVQVDIIPKEKELLKNRITITCDGPLEVDYLKNIATFNNNVAVEAEDVKISSDKMDVYFFAKPDSKQDLKEVKDVANASDIRAGSKIDKIIAYGNVKIIKGDNISYSDEAVYSAVDKKIALKGKPKLVIYSTEGVKNAPFGN